jgi:lipopolysaccharide transport system ATP-binding protein
MSFAIRVDNLSKRYRLGATHADSIRELVNRAWKRVFGRQQVMLPHEEARLRGIGDRAVEEDGSFWALRDISFEIKQGDVVGIIGRNGSGKSTLLKILSQITAPTSGRAELHGRVASLLEVGTGFHPELSGRENVFLNGAILGMTKTEIRRKFDEIVAFAEIEKFIDTPVKRYSSGMYVRLAFAVAAHLEPEILIVDEVLAVGDAAFQEKCMGKMSDVSRLGRTILFVSHGMAAIRGLCDRGVLLDGGKICAVGKVNLVVDKYESLFADESKFSHRALETEFPLIITDVVFKDSSGTQITSLPSGAKLVVELHYRAKEPLDRPHFVVVITGQFGHLLVASMLLDGHCPDQITGEGALSCVFESLPLLPQTYSVEIAVRDRTLVTALAPSMEVGRFAISGRMRDHGFSCSRADVEAADSGALVVLPYEWHFPDGKMVAVPGLLKRHI